MRVAEAAGRLALQVAHRQSSEATRRSVVLFLKGAAKKGSLGPLGHLVHNSKLRGEKPEFADALGVLANLQKDLETVNHPEPGISGQGEPPCSVFPPVIREGP